MAIFPIEPRRRIQIGRAITLLAGAVWSFTRAGIHLAAGPERFGDAGVLLTFGGRVPYLWVGLWAAAGILCLIDLARRHTRYGLALTVGLALAWASAHLMLWAAAGFTGLEWVQVVAYAGPALIIFGLLVKVTALHDMVDQAARGDGGRPPRRRAAR